MKGQTIIAAAMIILAAFLFIQSEKAQRENEIECGYKAAVAFIHNYYKSFEYGDTLNNTGWIVLAEYPLFKEMPDYMKAGIIARFSE